MSAYRCPGENYWTESNIQCASNYINVFARKLTWYFIGYYIINFIIKFRYNARSDWLKERALSEYRARSVEKWRTNLCFGILTNLTPIKRPLWLGQTKRINTDYMEAIVNNSSVKTVRNLQVMLSFRQTTDENTVIE